MEGQVEHKQLYEIVMRGENVGEALGMLVKGAVAEGKHFDFLLHRVDWFNPPYLYHFQHLAKVLRLYRGKSKEAALVCFHVLIEGMRYQHSCDLSVAVLLELLGNQFVLFVQSLREGFPHKSSPIDMMTSYLHGLILLCKALPQHRISLFELILHKFAQLEAPNSTESQPSKLQPLILQTLTYLRQQPHDELFFKQWLMVFHSTLLKIQDSSLIQFLMFDLAEQQKKYTRILVSFMMGTLVQWYHTGTHLVEFIQLNHYLSSYALSSSRLSTQRVQQVLQTLIKQVTQNLKISVSSELACLQTIYTSHIRSLYVIQTIMLLIVAVKADMQQYAEFFALCSSKVQFMYFIHPELLHNAGIQPPINVTARISFVDKFPQAQRAFFHQLSNKPPNPDPHPSDDSTHAKHQ